MSAIRKSAALSACAAIGFFCVSANAAVTGWWSMEEGTGTTTVDNVSSVNSNAFGPGISWTTPGMGGAPGSTQALNFTAAGDVGTNRTGVDLNITGTGAKTFSAWIRTTDGTGRNGVLSYSPTTGQDAGADLRMVLNNGTDLRLEVNMGASVFSLGSSIADGNWHFIAASIPANATTDDITWYLDGASLGLGAGNGQAIDTASVDNGASGATTEFFIGNDQLSNDPDGLFDGDIDYVAIYDEALSTAQLDDLFTNGVPEPATMALLAVGGVALLRRR